MKAFLNSFVVMIGLMIHSFMLKSGLLRMVDFEDIAGIDGEDNMAGVQRKAYFCPIDDISALPGYKTAASTLAEYAEIEGDFTLVAGKNFWEITIEPSTGKIEDQAIEGEGNNSCESTYEFFIPGNRATHLGFIRKVLNTKGVWIVPEADGNYRVLGIKPGVPAITRSSTTTATNSEGSKGTTFTVKSIQNGPAPIYDGTLTLDNSESLSVSVEA
jgi:hypothetical protein